MVNLEDLEKVAERLGWQEKMQDFQFLAIGPLNEVIIKGTEALITEEDFEVQYPKFSKEKEAEINCKWQALNSPWPSKPTAAIKEIRVTGKTLLIKIRPAGFHQYIGTKSENSRTLDINRLQNLDKDYVTPLSFAAITVTKDNWIAIGRRSANMAVGARKLAAMPAGFFDPMNEVIKAGVPGKKKSFPSLLAFVAAELWEEMRITWYRELAILGLVHECLESQNPLIAVRIKLDLTRNEVAEKFEQMLREEGKEAEISRYDFVENTLEAVKNYTGTWTSHAASQFILHFAIPF